MAAFDPSAELSPQPGYRLVADSFATLLWDRGVLEGTVNWLSTNGYQIVSVPAGSWQSTADMHRDIAQALDFPGSYGTTARGQRTDQSGSRQPARQQ